MAEKKMNMLDKIKAKTVGKITDPMDAAAEYNRLVKQGPPNSLQYGQWERDVEAAKKRMRGGK